MKKNCLLVFLLMLPTFAFSENKIKVIKAGKVIDVVSEIVLTNQIILVDNGKIIDIGPKISIPKNAEIIDLSNATVLPGLMDTHTHLTFQIGDNYYEQTFRETPIDNAIVAPGYAKKTLEAGFTMVRNLGSGDLIDVSLRNAINKGLAEGPRMLVSTFPIGATGGHADFSGFNPNITWKGNEDFTGIADGVDEIRKRVRNNVKWGTDWIKMMATAGVLSEEESVGAAQYSFEEMKALCDEAHRWGKKVAAHAHGAEGIKMAIRAGADTIEHGSLLDDESINLMKEKKTYLIPTIYVLDQIIQNFSKKDFPEKILNKARSLKEKREESFKKAVHAGIQIVYGTDAGIFPHGENAKDFAYMVKAGMTPMQAIQSATIHAADMLEWRDKTGSITAGKWADIIAVEKNPMDDISALEHVKFVMKEGVVYKNEINKK